MKKNLFLFFSFLILISGCMPGNDVRINTGNIFLPILFSIDNKDLDGKTLDLGEFLLTDDPLNLKVRIYNKTDYNYTNLDLTFDAGPDRSASVGFTPNPSGEIAFPGADGNCKRILKPKESCFIDITFTPREARDYSEHLKLSFKNYVDSEEHIGTLKILAGMPASVIFSNDRTQYTFGQLVGPNQIPVVERAETTVYEENLELLNAGGLPAKNIIINLAENCASLETNACPAGMFGAYRFEHQCPKVLEPGEKCSLRVTYSPKNQDPTSGPVPNDIKEINYRATLTADYIKDPRGGMGSINGYFRSLSTNIEAIFKVSQSNLVFETPVVSGNRDVRTFRINNLGYREGEIKGIRFRDQGGSFLAFCRKDTVAGVLCFDQSNNQLSLADFPFFFTDRNNCLSDGEHRPLINVNDGCSFDITFQPSVTYLTNKESEFKDLQPEVVFDARWRGEEKIVSRKMFNLSANSITAGRLVPDKFRLDGVEFPITNLEPGLVNLGRLALQSPNFFKRKSISITFKNIGNTTVKNLSISDGKNRPIPIGGSSISIGSKSPYFYSSVLASETSCILVAPGDTCSISMQFAPIGLNTNEEETNNMFDAIDASLKYYKAFKIHYNSGASFKDTTLYSTTPDYSPDPSEIRLYANLIRKGLLMQLADDSRNVSVFGQNINVTGDTLIKYIFLQNIGTGTIPYIRLLDPPTLSTEDFILTPTLNPNSLGADFDCLDLVDNVPTSSVPANADPSTRIGNFLSLPKDSSCVYQFEIRKKDHHRKLNPNSCNNSLTITSYKEEGIRFFSRDITDLGRWEFCQNNNFDKFFNFSYFDGDNTDPTLPSGNIYGTKFNLTEYLVRPQFLWAAKIIPDNFEPSLTATVYRPEINYPSIPEFNLPSRVIPEKWFYGLGSTYFKDIVESTNTSNFIKGGSSRLFVPYLNAFQNRSNYDYVLYIGSFPEGSPSFNVPISLVNHGAFRTKITSFSGSGDEGFQFVNSPPIPQTVTPGGTISPLTLNFSTSQPGENLFEIEYTYESGKHLSPLIYKSSTIAENASSVPKEVISQKILVVAYVEPTGSYPYLSLTSQDYEVIEDPGKNPIETPLSPMATPLSWNTSSLASTLVFDTVKLTATPKFSDTYAKKVLTLKNNSAYTLYDLKILPRISVTSISSKILSDSFKMLPGSTCTNGMNIGAGNSCSIVYRYQPVSTDISDNFVLSFLYSFGTGKYVTQNIALSLLPRSPGQIVAKSQATEPINYKITPTSSTVTRNSYPLNLGSQKLDESPKNFSFSDESGTFKKLQLVNNQSTKASLLLSYHKLLASLNQEYSPSNPPPTSTVPKPSDYRTHTDGLQYVLIHQATYPDSTPRLRIEASKGCLFGDDEDNASIPHHQKGFNSGTVTPCNLLVNLRANFSFLRRNLLSNNGDDMRDTASELWYYSVNRSSTASIWVHIKGTIDPDTSITSGAFANVQTSEYKTVTFSVPKLTANKLGVGNIIGLRVLMSSSSTGLSNPYATDLKYIDIRNYDPNQVTNVTFTTDLANGQMYWFKVIAIRYHSSFMDGNPKRFVGLRDGEYLSDSSNSLKTVVPPLNHHWFHNQKILVEKTLRTSAEMIKYSTASSLCSGTKVTIKTPTNASYTYQMINKAAWDLLLATPSATNYSMMTNVTHWLSDAPVSIDAKCSSIPGFQANVMNQLFEPQRVFYLRNDFNYNASVNTAVGGIPGSGYSNFTSYVDGNKEFGRARCMATIP